MYINGKFYSSSREYRRQPHTKKKRIRYKELKQDYDDLTPIVNFFFSCALFILFLVLHFS